LNFIIQDAKLFQLKIQNKPGAPDKDIDTYLNGFGQDFHVVSGKGRQNKLLVSNPLSEDYAAIATGQGSMKRGYVQVYVLDEDQPLLQWVQKTDPAFFYLHRFNENGTDGGEDEDASNGFGVSVGWFDGAIVVGQAVPVDKQTVFHIFNFVGEATEKSGIQAGNPPTKSLNINSDTLYPVDSDVPIYSQHVLQLKDELLFTVFTSTPGSIGSLYSYSITASVKSGEAPTITYETVMANVGKAEYLIQAPQKQTRVGFGQYIGSWQTRTRRTHFLVLNDPSGVPTVHIYGRSLE